MNEPTGTAAPPTAPTAPEAAAQLGDKARHGIKRLSATAHKTVDRMTAAAINSTDRLSAGKFANSAQQWSGKTCLYIREHPVSAVGIAVAAGYLLSRLRSFR